MFTKEAVEEALRLTAMGCCGILSKENAEESLNKLPEDLSRAVMAATISAKMIEQDLKSGKSFAGGNSEGNLRRRSESIRVICYNSKST